MFVDNVFSKLAYLVSRHSQCIVCSVLGRELQVSLRLRRVARNTSASLAPASSAVEVRDHRHEVWLGHRIILVYDMSM